MQGQVRGIVERSCRIGYVSVMGNVVGCVHVNIQSIQGCNALP